MVTAHETKEGAVLREDFIKAGHRRRQDQSAVHARRLLRIRPDPQDQLLTNSKPTSVRGQDHGIWQRVLLVAYRSGLGVRNRWRPAGRRWWATKHLGAP